MARRPGERFSAIRTEGGLLPSDLLDQLLQRDAKLEGLNETAYHVVDVRLHEAITESWTRLGRVWGTFQGAIAGLENTDPGTSVTRERWLLPLFQELGYGRLPAARPVEVGGKAYPVSHLWQHFPVHLVGWNVGLGERTRGVAGAARVSPHGLVQELLSRSSALLWGAVSNGRQFRLLRDNVVVFKGKIGSLRRFKDDAKEVTNGMECGISIANYGDIKARDVIEAFVTERIAAEVIA